MELDTDFEADFEVLWEMEEGAADQGAEVLWEMEKEDAATVQIGS